MRTGLRFVRFVRFAHERVVTVALLAVATAWLAVLRPKAKPEHSAD